MKTLSLLALAVGMTLPAQDNQPLTLSKTIALPQIEGGFNHISVDAGHQRLFLTATTKKTVDIVDLASGKAERALPGDGPAAALFAREFNQLYVSRGKTLCIYDGTGFDLTGRVDLQSRLDELGYDPKNKRLYIGCMDPDRSAITIVSVPDGSTKGEMQLSAKPQGFVVEQRGNRIFVNTPTLNQIAVLDRENQTTVTTWAIKNATGNYPIGLDETNHRLFVGCRRPARLVVFDTIRGSEVAAVPISEDTDDLSFDAKRNRIYVTCGSGFIDVMGERNPDSYALLQRIPTRQGARNSCFSPESNQFYLAVPTTRALNAEIRVYQCR